ncbi:uncharacterized protein LOC128346042 isoform X2 [Hemicordylus capensis]|uniref:uncharacterized protein LOC128346042 isoform X2 n=1 Tax=Hemicordylus capensis TaxID=884348 RepID=UPI002302D877|nr:uncharacterized protein LOC128346042 isoform X2 [Hemicordylus capensis]
MDPRGLVSPTFSDPPCSMSDSTNCGDDELDEETVNFISALYTALGPLLPEVTKLQGHQDPPAHLMVDMKAKLRELGSSVSDARKRLLRYNIYLKKRLAKAVQEKRALKEQQQFRQQPGQDSSEQSSTAFAQRGIRTEMEPGKPSVAAERKIQEIPELVRTKNLERVHRRSMKLQDPHFAESVEDRARAYTSPQGILQRASRPPFDRAQQ